MVAIYGLRRPLTPAQQVAPPEPELNEFQKAVQRGLRGFSPSAERTQAAAQAALGHEAEAQARIDEAARREQEIAQAGLAPRVGRVEDIENVGDFGDYAASVLGENLPLLGGMAAGALTGGAGARALGAGRRLTKASAALGGATPYATTSVGEVTRDIMTPEARGTLQEQGIGALGYGGLKTAVGLTPFGVGARMLGAPGGRLARGAKVGGASALAEGATETLEEGIGQFAETQFVPGAEMFSDDALSDYLNAAAGGALLGGVTGGAAGVLAPRNLQRSMEHSMQTAVEQGKPASDGASQWLRDNGALLNDDELAALGPEIDAFQPQAPRSAFQRRMDEFAAKEDLDIAFSQIPGPENLQAEFNQTINRRAEALASLVGSGYLQPDAPEVQGFVQQYPEQFRVALKEFYREQGGGGGQRLSGQLEEAEMVQGGLQPQEPEIEFEYNREGQPWHLSRKKDAESAARKGFMDSLTVKEKLEYKKAEGKDKKDWEKRIKEESGAPVKWRTALLREAQARGNVGDVNAFMMDRVRQTLETYAGAKKGSDKRKLYEQYADRPEDMLDEFGVVARPKPAGVVRKVPEGEVEPGKVIHGFKKGEEIQKYRIPVEVYEVTPEKGEPRWIKRHLNPMAAALKAQKTVKFDPNASRDVMMRQILDGLGSTLGSVAFEGRRGDIDSRVLARGEAPGGTQTRSAIRLTEEGIPDNTIMYQSKVHGVITWADVQEWAATKNERGKLRDYFRQETGRDDEENIDHSRDAQAPLPISEGQTSVGGIQKEPGPYLPDPSEYTAYAQRDKEGRLEKPIVHSLLKRDQDPLMFEEFPVQIISGGQTGVDVGGLVGAESAGIETGGTAPKGYRTDVGDKPEDLKGRFGLAEDKSRSYQPRTKKNVLDSDLTVIFRPQGHRSPGTRLTIKLARENNVPYVVIDPYNENAIDKFRQAIRNNLPKTINIAGPREKSVPGITAQVARIVRDTFIDPDAVESGLKFSGVPKKDQTKVDKLIDQEDPARQRRHQNVVNEMTKRIGLASIRVLDAKTAVAIMVAHGHGGSITSKNGFIVMHNGEQVIYVNPTLAEDAAMEVLGHELGHAVLDQTWSKAPRRLKKAVREDFKAYLTATGASPTVYEAISKRTPQRLLEHTIFGDKDVYTPWNELTKAEQEYLLSFEEWFADNVAKWMVTDAKPRSLIQQFFKHVADLLRDLWSNLVQEVNIPEKSVQIYMDRVFQAEPAKNFEKKFNFGFSEVPAASSSIHGANWSNIGDEAAIHEAMKEFLTEEEMNVLGNEVHRPFIRQQLIDFYGADPLAMEAIDNHSTRKMIPLMYKAWRAGAMKIRKRPESFLMKLMEKAAELLGIIMNDTNAEALMRDISRGAVTERVEGREAYTQTRVNETAIQQARSVIERLSAPALDWAVRIGGTAEMRVRWANNPALTEMWKQIYLSPDTAGGKEGFFAATRRVRAHYEKQMHSIFDGKDEEFGSAMADFLNKRRDIRKEGTAEEKEVFAQVRKLLDDVYRHTVRAGVDQGYIEKDYFPRVYDMDKLVKHRDEFINMLVERYPIDLQEYYSGLYPKKEGAPPPTKTNEEIAAFIHRNLTTAQGDTLSAEEHIAREGDQDPLGWPAIDSIKKRSLAWIEDKDVADYMSDDLGLTLSTYIHQSAKRAEYNRRFGVGTGRKLVTSYLRDAEESGASEQDLTMAENAMKAALGTLGADINPTLHKWQGIIMVLENWMLLGLATLTSLVDPMGIAVRGDLDTAWQSLTQGIKEVRAKLKGDQTELSKMAGLLGINELHNTVEALGYEYGGYYVTGAARRWNDRLFSINMLTQWTRVTRTMALAGARRFVGKHAPMDNAKSKRFMHELGLREGDVQLDADGNAVILDDRQRQALDDVYTGKDKSALSRLAEKREAEYQVERARLEKLYKDKKIGYSEYIHGINSAHSQATLNLAERHRTKLNAQERAKEELDRDERVRQALNRWVDEAILRPDAAQRPIWASDPHWMLVFHLKAFTYSFHERILRRVGHEIMQGNYQPVVMLMGYLPMMYAAEALRNGLQGDEDWEPEGFFETTHHLAQRSGLYGIGQFYFDVKDGWRYGDTPFSVLGGPSVEHALSIGEAAFTASQADDERALVRSMPFHNLWKEWYE